ncbi:hypothetical protein L1987_05640 [Smallanthus sonchifolius]|uniref:Uncharacterized protein n=1 Tax=Smallanthus sonchifolius TaxID=185202 RepID=A0ACB9JVX9_9ASTR|nr:hypothetical protein L1987_05640 [Smallanthus sonchifolius]
MSGTGICEGLYASSVPDNIQFRILHLLQDSSSSAAITASTTLDFEDDDEIYLYNVEGGGKFKNFFHKMIWNFGFACFLPLITKKQKDEMKSKMVNSLEHNKAWLLAESGGCVAELGNAEPHLVHSSFRFSLCSQVELESMSVSSSGTVLMVNLDNGLMESRSQELKWRRIESLERSISPITLLDSAMVKFFLLLTISLKGRVGILKTAVAIKKLDKEDKEAPKAFCRELMIASSIHSPFICPLVGFCIDPEGGLFLIYKYVSGGSLERYLHGRKPIESRRRAGEENLVLWTHSSTDGICSNFAGKAVITPRIHREATRIKFTQRNLDQNSRMIQATKASINNEESKRPNIDVIISILKGVEANAELRKTPGTTFSSNTYVIDG